MLSRIRRGLIISISVIALFFAAVITSYSETTTYIYDELNRLIEVIYEDGSGVIYTYDPSGNRITLSSYPDTVPPTGTITINSGASQTCIPAVTLTLSCSDNVGCSQMQFSNDNVTYSTPEAYETTKSWTLSPGDGTKTVYAKFEDVAGNWSTAYGDTIELLTTDSYTKSLLHMNGTDGSTTFTDSAGAHTWTAHGNAQIDTAQSKFGGASGLFDGSGDYISSPDSDDWYFNGDFTIDLWVRFKVVGDAMFFDQHESTAREICFHYNNASHWLAFDEWYASAYTVYFTVPWSPSANTWYHIALVRSGNTWYIFINGTAGTKTLRGGAYANALHNIAGPLDIGVYYTHGTSFALNGWIDEYRISKGIARWTSNFTPPTNEYCP